MKLLTNQSSLTLHPSPTAALLKTPSKTYSLRQKNTSNALILLKPYTTSLSSSSSSSSGLPNEENDRVGGGGGGGLITIATVHETIELVPEADAAAEAAPKARGKWHEKFARGR